MTIEAIIKSFSSLAFNPWSLFKIFFLVLFLFYVAFAVIVVRQVKLMSQVLNGYWKFPLSVIAWAHLLIAVAILFLALVIL